MEGRFSDGRSARTLAVLVTVQADGLLVQLPDWPTGELWPSADLLIADRDARRLTRASDTDVRLTLSEEDFAAITSRVAHLTVHSEKRKAAKLVAVLAAAGASLAAVIYFGIPAAAGPLARATPIHYEKQLGESVDAQLSLAFRRCRMGDAATKAVLQARTDDLVRQSTIDFPVTVELIDTPMVNAFALPGGRVWLTSGLIDAATSGDQVLAVISHELAHVENRDVMVNLYRALGFGLILDAVLGGGSGAGQQLIMLGTNLADMKHSRDVETRADARGAELLHAAGYASTGFASFFDIMGKLEGGSEDRGEMGDWVELVASHPDTERRIAAAREREKPGDAAFNQVEWQAVKAVCGASEDGK